MSPREARHQFLIWKLRTAIKNREYLNVLAGILSYVLLAVLFFGPVTVLRFSGFHRGEGFRSLGPGSSSWLKSESPVPPAPWSNSVDYHSYAMLLIARLLYSCGPLFRRKSALEAEPSTYALY